MKSVQVIFFAISLLVIDLQGSILSPISGRDPYAENNLKPADVLSRARLVHDELDIIRKHMGLSYSYKKIISVQGASPVQVYAQAQELLDHINEFAWDLDVIHLDSTKPESIKKIVPKDVWFKVNDCYKQVLQIKRKLLIDEEAAEVESTNATTPSEVFEQIAKTFSLAAFLMPVKLEDTELYMQVQVCINTASRLLSINPNLQRIPEKPEFVEKISHQDLLQEVSTIFPVVQEISTLMNLQPIQVQIKEQTEAFHNIVSIHKMVAMLEGELAYFHSHFKLPEPEPALYPGRKFPSHCLQSLKLLKIQLESFRKELE